jgi:hypothetical protein
VSTVGQKRDDGQGRSKSNPTLQSAIVPRPPTTTATPGSSLKYFQPIKFPFTLHTTRNSSPPRQPQHLSTSEHRHNKAPIPPIPRSRNNYLSMRNSPKIAENSNCVDHRLAGTRRTYAEQSASARRGMMSMESRLRHRERAHSPAQWRESGVRESWPSHPCFIAPGTLPLLSRAASSGSSPSR